jgi:O-antigen chain-terminating methyltransferase
MKGAFRILKPGGQLVIETVNPHSPAALKTFWLDLTHTRPIFPESIIDLAIRSNFQSGYIVFPYGSGNWDEDIRHAGEYAAFIKK